MSDIQYYRIATVEEFKPYILMLGGDYYNMDLVEMNAFMYTKIKENPRLFAIKDEIIDETNYLFTAQLFNFGSYFQPYNTYIYNVNIDQANIEKMNTLYDYINAKITLVNEYLEENSNEYPAVWVTNNQDFITSHPASHFKNHTWGESYDISTQDRFNYPVENNGWSGVGLGMTVTEASNTPINFFDKQDSNLNGVGFTARFWNEDKLYSTPFPHVTLSNNLTRSARNSYICSRMPTIFDYDTIGTYTDYLYFIEVDFRLGVGLDAQFFSILGIDTSEIITKMDQWDIVNINREDTYHGTRINIQRGITTLESFEDRMKTDKIIIDGMGV